MKVNWLKALPIGFHIKEALEDIKIIRSGIRATKNRRNSYKPSTVNR